MGSAKGCCASAARSACFFCRLTLAQRFFCAAAIFSRASELSTCLARLLAEVCFAACRLVPSDTAVDAASARARVSRAIAASSSFTKFPVGLRPVVFFTIVLLSPLYSEYKNAFSAYTRVDSDCLSQASGHSPHGGYALITENNIDPTPAELQPAALRLGFDVARAFGLRLSRSSGSGWHLATRYCKNSASAALWSDWR